MHSYSGQLYRADRRSLAGESPAVPQPDGTTHIRPRLANLNRPGRYAPGVGPEDVAVTTVIQNPIILFLVQIGALQSRQTPWILSASSARSLTALRPSLKADSSPMPAIPASRRSRPPRARSCRKRFRPASVPPWRCLLYTSDAADERSSV